MNVSSSLFSRREMLRRAGAGFGFSALATLLAESGFAASPTSPDSRWRTRPAKAKSVIWLFMNGGPSQVDTFDYKPALAEWNDKPLPGFDINTAFDSHKAGNLMASPWKFRQHGQSGRWVSELFPHMATQVDKMAFIHSCHTDSNNHSPALYMMNTGTPRMGKPSFGSWSSYGLGSENSNLPAFVVMADPRNRGLPRGKGNNWGSGFLPSRYQGTFLQPKGEPIANLAPPSGSSESTRAEQRADLDLLAALNRPHLEAHPAESDLDARIASFELAFRMQTQAPEVFDLAGESETVRKAYGLDAPHCGHFARQCITARRLVERGVRFVQLYSGGSENQQSWDCHANLKGNHGSFAAEVDQPIAALLRDLEQRGLLDSTLVIWGGEFGRLPTAQKDAQPGRDHNPHGFTLWMAGAGVKPGVAYGATDEFGHKAAVDKVHIHDLHATWLHLLGVDHEKLTYRFNGRDFRLTDVHGKVVQAVLA
jgi:hypothetical protein